MAHMAPQQGMNWRDYMGAIICLIGYKVIFIGRNYIEPVIRTDIFNDSKDNTW